MKLAPMKPKKSLNKAFLKLKPMRDEIEAFKVNLINFYFNTFFKSVKKLFSKISTQNLISHLLPDSNDGFNRLLNQKVAQIEKEIGKLVYAYSSLKEGKVEIVQKV